MAAWLIVLTVGLAAGTLGGLLGFGGTTVLLPVLTLVFGPKAAVPIMAIAAILANISRVAVWWREILWMPAIAFSITAVPAAWLGARTMLSLDPKVLELCIGIFFIAIIVVRRMLVASSLRVGLTGMAAAGVAVGYLTGIVANTGPLSTPFFLAYGLVKGAFIGTEALASVMMFGSKTAAFRAYDALPPQIVVNGLMVGTSMMAGAYIAKQLMNRITSNLFRHLMDLILFISGAAMIAAALM